MKPPGRLPALGFGVLRPISDCLSHSSWPSGTRSQRRPNSSVSLDVTLKESCTYRPSLILRSCVSLGGLTVVVFTAPSRKLGYPPPMEPLTPPVPTVVVPRNGIAVCAPLKLYTPSAPCRFWSL